MDAYTNRIQQLKVRMLSEDEVLHIRDSIAGMESLFEQTQGLLKIRTDRQSKVEHRPLIQGLAASARQEWTDLANYFEAINPTVKADLLARSEKFQEIVDNKFPDPSRINYSYNATKALDEPELFQRLRTQLDDMYLTIYPHMIAAMEANPISQRHESHAEEVGQQLRSVRPSIPPQATALITNLPAAQAIPVH